MIIKQQLEVTLRQPQDEAFDFFTDFRNEPAWNPDCLIVEKTSDGPIGVGTKPNGKMRRVGPNSAEVVAYDRPNRCTVIDRSRGGTHEGRTSRSRCRCSRRARCGCSSR